MTLPRRTFLKWTGVGTMTVLGSGYFLQRASADTPTDAEAPWTFDSTLGMFAQPVTTTGTAVGWEFNTDGDAEGWTPANGLADFTVSGGTLKTTVTGFDPYMIAAPIDLVGRRDRVLRLRASLSAGDSFKVYFATKESPQLAEDKTATIAADADGAFHEYEIDLGAANSQWANGTVQTFRLDREPPDADGAAIEFDYIRVDMLGSRLAVAPLSVSKGSVLPGDDVVISTALANAGGQASPDVTVRLTLPDGIELASGDAVQTIPSISPDGRHELSWTARVTAPSPAVVTVDFDAAGSSQQLGAVVAVVPKLTPGDAWWPAGVHAFLDHGNAYLQNGDIRLICARTVEGFSQLLLSARSDDAWQPVASGQPLSWLLVPQPGGVETLPLVPDTVRVGASSLALSGSVSDANGTRWTANLTFTLADGARNVRADYAVAPDRRSEFVAFRGPSLTAGERSFGGDKKAALFPGLEWLVAGESSSSTLDIDPPNNLRTTPHPLKVTTPLMAVATDGAVVGVQWNFTGNGPRPSARFSSPNWLDGQDNHLLALFLPAVPDYVAENAPLATTPYVAQAGEQVAIAADFVADATNDVLRAVDDWQETYGVPAPGEMPFSWDDELSLLRYAYTYAYWSPDVKGWPHVYGNPTAWPPSQFPLLATNLQIAGLLAAPGSERDAALSRVEEFVASAFANKGAAGFADLGGAHIIVFHAPYYLGHLEGSLPVWQQGIDDTLDDQLPNGAWPFIPSPDDASHQRLGPRGAPIMGLTATNGQRALRYARMTGYRRALDAGMRAIGFLDGFDVPRAAQSWEVPIHTPDVLAAGYGIGAYAEAYRLTGDRRYLQRALYWARAGLPFLYAWADPDRPLMPYASIPVFGATLFTGSWFGVPVQWNGLVYAYYLLDLIDAATNPDGTNPFTLDAPAWRKWRQIAEGVVISALHQQRTAEPAKGGYPDNWPLIPNKPVQNVDINPDAIAKPTIMLRGHQVDVRTTLLRRAATVVRLNTAADVLAARWTSAEITADLGFYPGATSQLSVVGAPAPRSVLVDDRELPAVQAVDDVPEGWKVLGNGSILVKLRHDARSTLSLRF